MEKKPTSQPQEENLGLEGVKLEDKMLPRDVDLGQMLEFEATPQQERQVLRKLDLV